MCTFRRDSHSEEHPVWKDLSFRCRTKSNSQAIILMEGDGSVLGMESRTSLQDWELRASAGIRAWGSCEVRGKTQRVWRTLWNGGNPGLIVQQCLLVLRQLRGKECVAYIPSVDPASASPTPTLTVSTVRFKRLHTKNNKGWKTFRAHGPDLPAFSWR